MPLLEDSKLVTSNNEKSLIRSNPGVNLFGLDVPAYEYK